MESFGIVGGLRCRSGWHEEEEELGVIPVGATGQRSRGTRIIGRAGRSECRTGNEKISNDPVFREDERYEGGRAREPRAGCRPTGNWNAR